MHVFLGMKVFVLLVHKLQLKSASFSNARPLSREDYVDQHYDDLNDQLIFLF